MKTDDLENELRNLKFAHLTESELASYEDSQLDRIGSGRVEAHLKQCFICQRQLELLREENAALSHRVVTPGDVAFVERLMERTGSAEKSPAAGDAEIARDLPLRERLSEYLRQMIASWQAAFQAVRHGAQGEELWRWQSEDGRVLARATMEKNADMIVQVSSTELGLDGTKLRFRLGQLSQELTLRRISESEVAAQLAIPWPYRRGGVIDISIEIL